MTAFRRFRLLLPVLATVGLAVWASLTLLASPATAFQVEDAALPAWTARS